MATGNIKILSTRPVSEALVRSALHKKVQIDVLSFIETEALHDIETQQEIEWASTEEVTVVFTSMNAVEAVTPVLDGFIPEWRIYCMGQTTRERIEDYFGTDSIAGSADSAAELAEQIIGDEVPDEVIFFCGNKRREELPVRLRSSGIEVTEIVVYETTAIAHKVEAQYQGVLFFSPSAVESFFTTNPLHDTAVVFAIGDTTAKAVRAYCGNKIITARHPGKDALAEQAVEYFS